MCMYIVRQTSGFNPARKWRAYKWLKEDRSTIFRGTLGRPLDQRWRPSTGPTIYDGRGIAYQGGWHAFTRLWEARRSSIGKWRRELWEVRVCEVLARGLGDGCGGLKYHQIAAHKIRLVRKVGRK